MNTVITIQQAADILEAATVHHTRNEPTIITHRITHQGRPYTLTSDVFGVCHLIPA